MRHRSLLVLAGLIYLIFTPTASYSLDPGTPDTVIVQCPQTIQDTLALAGDTFQVEIWLFNDEMLGGFSVGFEYNSDKIMVDSVDTTGSILGGLTGLGSFQVTLDSAGQTAFFGWAFMPGLGIPAGSERQLLSKLNFIVLDDLVGGTNINIDSAFIAPAGYFVLTDSNGYDILPKYIDCGTQEVTIVSTAPEYTYSSDPSFIFCPGGDLPFKVRIENNGSPVVGYSDIWVEFTNYTTIQSCTSFAGFDSIPPAAPSDQNGEVTFFAAGGGCDLNALAVVKTPTGSKLSVPVRALDVNGDLVVTWFGDWDIQSSCCDFDNSGSPNFYDDALLRQHQFHGCVLDPCDRFGYEFRLTPAENLDPGMTVSLELLVANNNFEDSCEVGYISFYHSGFGSDDVLVHDTTVDYYGNLAPGERDSVTVTWKVPDNALGWGCFEVNFTTTCCEEPVKLSRCIKSIQHCVKDSNICYQFTIIVTDPEVEDYYIQGYLPNDDWSIYDINVPSLPITPPDTGWIVYEVCTPNMGNLGDAAGVIATLCYGDNCENTTLIRNFFNRVIITTRTGDCDGNCYVNISDVVYIIAYIFAGGPEPLPYKAGDVDCNDIVNISDAVYLIAYIFGGGPPPCEADKLFL